MNLTDSSKVSLIKSRLNPLEIYRETVQDFHKAGKNHVGFCPFHHNVNTPSFVVFEDGGWKCFGECNQGGDIISFVMKRDNLDFLEAIKKLGGMVGVDCGDNSQGLSSESRRQWEKLMETVWECYQRYRSFDATAYLEKRFNIPIGILGYAPKEPMLGDCITDKDLRELLIQSGLSWRDEHGHWKDLFRDRIIIPIVNQYGRIIAFAGRVIGDVENQPKFINSPNNPIFTKSQVWFGLMPPTMRQSNGAIIVEGYFDVLVARAYGYHNVISPMGTSISAGQLNELSKLTKTAILALDPDKAGQRAIIRGVVEANKVNDNQVGIDWRGLLRTQTKNTLDIYVAELPDKKDPDQLIMEDQLKWEEIIKNPVPAPRYLIQKMTKDRDMSVLSNKREVIESLAPILSGISDDLSRGVYLRELMETVGVDESTMKKIMSKQEDMSESTINITQSRLESMEKEILSGVISAPIAKYWITRNLALAKMPDLSPGDFESTDLKIIAEAWWKAVDQDEVDWIASAKNNIPESLLPTFDNLHSSWHEDDMAARVGRILRLLLNLRNERGKQRLEYLIHKKDGKEIINYQQSRGKIEKALKHLEDFMRKGKP